MKVVIVNVNKSRVQKNIEYHLYTIKTFIDARSYGSIDTEIVNVFMSDDMTTSVNLIENANAEIILFRALYWNISFILKFEAYYIAGITICSILKLCNSHSSSSAHPLYCSR